MTRSSVLLGRLLSETLRSLLSIVVMSGCGLLVGFRFHAGPGEIVLGFGLLLLLGFGFSWVAAYIGLVAGSVEGAQGLGMIWVFPFVFVSSAFGQVLAGQGKLGHDAGPDGALPVVGG
ncbi:ABC-type Na+ efflux pump permease subunit [Nonomuraea thailandensis]|uniref:ABC-type Na+ efflux pump permease subunit n=1 Tax=Nonomuraea thailandensis TaxID=1188745 RepID=A0A9X2GFG2_9ACTN|nr:ABC transporter permease [Nonomuraea thailandensis]MCP2356850.1 ABC-type Na+ efflux pump permease subunit [Nonomuraea thailandensis]